jgi:DNA-binding protein YbaB
VNRDTYDSRRLLAEVEAKVATAKQNAETVAALEGWGEAAEGRVKVCVGPSGALKNVELDPRAMRLPSQDLAASILEAARAGQQAVAEQVRGIYGPESAGGIDIAAVAQGDLDVSAVIDAKLDQARQAIHDSR